MRVLLVHCFYRSSAPSGEDSVYRNEKKLLEDHGYDVITYEKYNDDLDNLSPIKKMAAGMEFIWSSRALREISEILATHSPDIAHFHNIFPQISSSAFLACKRYGVPVVQTLHNFRYICPAGLLQRDNKPCEKCIDGTLLYSLIHKCYRNSFVATLPMAAMIATNRLLGSFKNNVDHYITLTNFAKSRFVAGGLPPEKISVKPNFINEIDAFEPICGDYAVYVGRLTQEKGIATLIEACKQTKNIPVKIVGDGELRGSLETICIQHDLNVEFLGFQHKESVMSLIKKSRLLIMPSECYEGFPVTIAEAYACGKPVLGSKIGSLDEIIIEGITGRKFDFGSANSLSKTMIDMWFDLESLKFMSLQSRVAFDTLYNPEVNLKILSEIYNSLIANLSKERVTLQESSDA